MPDELTRRPLSDLGEEILSPERNQQQLRQYGTELLKRGMWKDLGVDYTNDPNRVYDDTPTQNEIRRQKAGGQPTIGDLQDRELQMEQRLQNPSYNRSQLPPMRLINLEPVEHNPFAVTLLPVEENPFGKEHAGEYKVAADTLPFPPGSVTYERPTNENYGSMAYPSAAWALMKQGAKYHGPQSSPPPPLPIVPK